MPPNAGGIGLSGHKTSYSTGVRQGNWVEDGYGREQVGTNTLVRPDPRTSLVV